MHTRRLRLGIDLDGVVADFNVGWITRFNRDHGTALRPGDARTWDAPVSMTGMADMDEFWAWFAEAGDDGGSIFADLDPYPDALDALDRLASVHDLVILSHKPDFAVHETLAWLGRHRVRAREVHLLEDKARVDCDVYLDDADHNLTAYLDHRPTSTVCRYVRPWNRHHTGVVDVADWSGFEAVVTRRALGGDGGAPT